LAFVGVVGVARSSDREFVDRRLAENGPELVDELRDQPSSRGLDVEPIPVTRRAAVGLVIAIDEPLLDESVDSSLDRRVGDVVAAVSDRVEQVSGRKRVVRASQDGEYVAFSRSELCPLGQLVSKPNRWVRPRW